MITVAVAKVLWENITSVPLRRNPWNKVLSKPFRITETSNCRRRGHLCRFHKNLSIVLLARWHSHGILNDGIYAETLNTLTEIRGFIFTCSYSKPMIIFPVSLCVRLKFLFLEYFQPAISTVNGFVFSTSV